MLQLCLWYSRPYRHIISIVLQQHGFIHLFRVSYPRYVVWIISGNTHKTELALLCFGGRSPEAYDSRRVFVCAFVFVCLCVCLSAESFPELVLRIRWKLNAETCNASLIQYYLEMKLVDFGLVTLLWSYGVIYVRLLTWRLFFTVRKPSKSKLPTKDCFSTW